MAVCARRLRRFSGEFGFAVSTLKQQVLMKRWAAMAFEFYSAFTVSSICLLMLDVIL